MSGYLNISQTRVRYGETEILKGVDLSVKKGEFVALLGSSGCGKTTLLRTVAGFNTPTHGTISIDGKDVTRLPPDKRGMALVFQSYALWPHMTVDQNIGYGLKLRRTEASIAEKRIDEMKGLLGLDALGHRKPGELSGGQRQRIAIARALAVEPVCLVADELVSALDVSVQAQVVNLLVDLQERLGLAIVFVAHDLRLVRHVSHRVAVIYLGSVVEIGPSESLFAAPLHPYSKALLASAPSLAPRRRRARAAITGELPSPLAIPAGCPFHPRCPHATEICRTERPTLSPMRDGDVACHHAATIAQ